MICDQCTTPVPKGEHHDHNGRHLCEDCYLDAVAAPRFCDPWADFNAKSFAQNNPETALTPGQEKILQLLKETGGADPGLLMERLKDEISPGDGQRECAALHRMGKITIENRNGTPFLKPA